MVLGTVLKNLLSTPVTRREGRDPLSGARAKLDIDLDRCVFCGLCQRRCPAGALEVQRAEKSWVLRAERCILCGFCVEGCPKGCLFMDESYRQPTTDRADLRLVEKTNPSKQ